MSGSLFLASTAVLLTKVTVVDSDVVGHVNMGYITCWEVLGSCTTGCFSSSGYLHGVS
jgi:hypothetical protein